MDTEIDLLSYHQSIARELGNAQNRIRQLIGKAHWLTDGEHKESILRRVLRNHIPETIRVGTGFVICSKKPSNQLDILLTAKSKPTLFKDEELTIVTPDAVEAIGEVKTKLDWSELKEALAKLADNSAMVRQENKYQQRKLWSGLFVYESMPTDDAEKILMAIYNASRGEFSRVVDLITLGPDIAAQFVEEEKSRSKVLNRPAWILYYIPGLSHAFYLSSLVLSIARDSPWGARESWLPLKKRHYRKCFMTIDGHFGVFPPEEQHPKPEKL